MIKMNHLLLCFVLVTIYNFADSMATRRQFMYPNNMNSVIAAPISNGMANAFGGLNGLGGAISINSGQANANSQIANIIDSFGVVNLQASAQINNDINMPIDIPITIGL